jgi:hypothetical protein
MTQAYDSRPSTLRFTPFNRPPLITRACGKLLYSRSAAGQQATAAGQATSGTEAADPKLAANGYHCPGHGR